MKSLRVKFLLYILIPVLVIIGLTGLISWAIARHIVRNQLEEIGMLSLRQAADEIDLGFGTGLNTLRIMSTAHGLPLHDHERLATALRELSGQFPPVESFFMGFVDGSFVSSLEDAPAPSRPDHRFQQWYIDALATDEVVVGAPRQSAHSGQEIATVARKITDKNGATVGVVGYAVRLEVIRQKLSNVTAINEYDATFSIILRDGTFLLRSTDDGIGNRLGQSPYDLHVRMRQALSEERPVWESVATAHGGWWWAGYAKSRYLDVVVGLEIPLPAAVWPLRVLAGTYLLLGLCTLVLLSVILVKMAHKITRPLGMLAQASSHVSRGEYGQPLPVTTHDELGRLIEAFNTMSEGLKQRDFIRSTFGRYLTQEVVDQLLEGEDGLSIGGETREMSFLMSDLRGFTAHTAKMAPKHVLDLLNRYLEQMVDILLDHKATVDEIQGDGILAFFGAPVAMEDHAGRAVSCAVAMQVAMEEINAGNAKEGLPHLEMGIAVNTGTAVVGNIGSERRAKYGVVGAEVNMTGRIESYTLGGQILVSESTHQRVKDLLVVRDVISVDLKGVHGTVRLYDVRGMRRPYEMTIPDSADLPRAIKNAIPVRVRRVDEKVVHREKLPAAITHLSGTGARITIQSEMSPFEEIRMDVMDEMDEQVPGEVFAKILSVIPSHRGCDADIRFTFVAPRIRRMFRRELMAP